MVLRFFSLAFAFFLASCSVPERDSPYDPNGINYQGGEPPVPPGDGITGSGWDRTGTVVLGGASNSSIGSFLDIDANPFKVYKVNEAAAAKDIIDIVFDGSNFLTPEGCYNTNNFLCGDRMMYGSSGGSVLFDVSSVSAIKATSTPNEILNYMEDYYYDSDLVVTAKKGGKFIMITTEADLALIIVNDITSASVTLSVGRVSLEGYYY